MQNKIKTIFTKSNKYEYAQIILQNKTVVTVRSDLLQAYKNEIGRYKNSKELTKLIALYNGKKISFKTFLYIFEKVLPRGRKQNLDENVTIRLATEYSWESGIIDKKTLLGFSK